MQYSDYKTIFTMGGIRAQVDWELLDPVDCSVTASYSRSVHLLGGLYSVWYRRPDGTSGDWKSHADRPVTIAEAAANLDVWPAERRRRIEYFAAIFGADAAPVQLALPAYAVADRTILLDGTHRAVAAVVAKVEVRVLLYALDGPRNPAILPDLHHYSS